MEDMEVDHCPAESSEQEKKCERGLKRTWLEINDDGTGKEKLTRSTGCHKLTIHCIRADTYAYSILKKDNSSTGLTQVPGKRRRLTNDDAERVIQTFTY